MDKTIYNIAMFIAVFVGGAIASGNRFFMFMVFAYIAVRFRTVPNINAITYSGRFGCALA